MSPPPSPEPSPPLVPSPAGAAPRRHYWPLVVVVVAIAVLVLLPIALRWGAEQWLYRQGMAQVAIRDVDLNLFLGELGVEGVAVASPTGERLTVRRATVRVAWWPLVRRRAAVDAVAIDGAVIDVVRAANGTLTVGGLPVGGGGGQAGEPTTQPGKPWGIAVRSVDLRDVQVDYRDGALAVATTVRRAHVGPLASWHPDTTTPFDLETEVNGGEVELTGEAHLFRSEPDAHTTLQVADLPLAWVAPLLHDRATDLDGTLDADLKVSAQYQPATASVTVSGTTTLANLHATTPQATVHHLSLTWDGTADLDLAAGAPAITTRGGLTLTDLDLDLPAPALRITEERAIWRGDAAYATPAQPADRPLLITGKVTVAAGDVADPKRGKVAAWDRLDVTGLRLEGSELVEAATLRLDGLRALPGMSAKGAPAAPYAVTLGQLAVDGARVWTGRQVEAEAVRLDGLRGAVTRAADGTLSVARWRPPAKAQSGAPVGAPPPAAGKAATDRGLVVRVDRFAITGDSAFTFTDQSVDPPFHLVAEPVSLHLDSLDQAQPDQASPIEARAKLGKYAEVSVTGTVAPFAARPTFAVKGSLSSIDLAPFTSYTTAAVGYRLKSGHLDGDLDVDVEHGALRADSDWLVNKLEMVRLTAEDKDTLSQGLGLPVNTALALLRDRDDNIRLKVPVTGDLGDPNLRLGRAVGKVVATALVKAINKAVVTYMAALSPPVAVALAAGKVVSLATALRFDPVAFAPGDATLDAAAVDYLDALAERLDERPGVRLNLCGIAVAADAAALVSPTEGAPAAESEGTAPEEAEAAAQGNPAEAATDTAELPVEALRQLAEVRGEAVADYLVRRGIAPERLFVCSPEVDDTQGAAPQVKISL